MAIKLKTVNKHVEDVTFLQKAIGDLLGESFTKETIISNLFPSGQEVHLTINENNSTYSYEIDNETFLKAINKAVKDLDFHKSIMKDNKDMVITHLSYHGGSTCVVTYNAQ
jgi:hypothetical protein